MQLSVTMQLRTTHYPHAPNHTRTSTSVNVYIVLTTAMDQDKRSISLYSSEPNVQSSFVGKALSEKNYHNVAVPCEFAWLQLNQGEKHLKYPSPTRSVLFSASHTFVFGNGIHWHVFFS